LIALNGDSFGSNRLAKAKSHTLPLAFAAASHKAITAVRTQKFEPKEFELTVIYSWILAVLTFSSQFTFGSLFF